MTNIPSHLLWLTVMLALSGCAGGGGGGGGETRTPVTQFTSWSAVQPNSKVAAQGMSQTINGTVAVGANGDVTVNPIGSFSTVDTSASSATLTFGSSRQLTGLQVNAPAGGVSWGLTLGGGTVSCGNGQCTASKNSGASEAVMIDPYAAGWNYQSFGVWQTGASPSGPVTFGAMSFGAPTPVNGLPAAGSATYNGLTAGIYVDPTGKLYATSATMSTNVDFGAHTIRFSTTGTQAFTGGGTALPNPGGLDLLSGTVSYNGTQFLIPVTTANSQLSGSANGRFYGPAAQEIGGVYNLTGAGASMGGAFGGKK